MYCEITDVRRRTPSIKVTDIADSLVTRYIQDAERIINGALYRMYAVPFPTAPDVIVVLCADIAAYLMMRDYPDKMFEDDLKRLEETYRETIEDILSGDTALIGETPVQTSSAGVFFYKVTGSGDRWDEQP